MKIIGALIIVVSSSWIGFLIAREFNLRPIQLREVQTALQMLETEISYGVVPLPEAFGRLAENLSKPVSEIFIIAQKRLKEGATANDAWREAVKLTYEDTALISADRKVLLDLGYNLGQSDADDQLKYLKLTRDKINSLYQRALTQREEKVKMWRYLGVLTGLVVVILVC